MPIVSRKLLVVVLTLVFICVSGVQAQDVDGAAPVPAQDPDSPFLLEPQTPEEFFYATVRILDQARPTMARKYLEKFEAANPDDQMLLKLRTKYGMSEFLRLAQTKELQPISTQLLDQVTTAFQKQNADPAYVDGLLEDLAGEPRDRTRALFALQSGGRAVVPRILQRIATTQNAQERDRFTYTLTQLGRSIVPVLLGAVDCPNDNAKAAAITAIGFLATDRAVTPLLYPAFGKDQPDGVRASAKTALARILKIDKIGSLTDYGVADKLLNRALEHYRGQVVWPKTADGGVELWTWDNAATTVVKNTTDSQAASLFVGSRLARQSLAVAPESKKAQAALLGLLLAEDLRQAGSGIQLPTGPGTAHDLALLAGPTAVSDALDLAMKSHSSLAMRGCLRVLSQLASRRQLQFEDARRGPIVTALNAQDVIVQYMAATTILQLDPDEPFPGSDRVVQILARMLNSNSDPHCLVVDANSSRASQMGALVAELGYQQLIEPTGRDGFKMAVDRSDIRLIALEINTIRWPLSQTVANFRADSRTAAIPIIVYGDERMQSRVRGLVSRDPLTEFVPNSQTSDFLESKVVPFLESIRGPAASPELMAQLRENSVYWLAHIATGHRTRLFPLSSVEDVLFEALSDEALAGNTLKALSAIPTRETQVALCDVVLNSNHSVPVRTRAASMLAFHIQRFGLVISDTQVQKLHASMTEVTDAGFATAMAGVIGSLKPNSELVSERLRQFQLPGSPVEVAPPAAGDGTDSDLNP